MEQATFAAGCFWGVEATFNALDGVTDTRVGYSGGTTVDPSYQQVCTGTTGHAEVVRVEYDPQHISYTQLLSVFWQCHNPTTRDRQGVDIGSQYRSAIFFHDAQQQQLAEQSKQQQAKHYSAIIVTEVSPAGPFYKAEEYHQRYFAKHGHDVCKINPDESA